MSAAAAPTAIIGMIENGAVKNSGAAFGGLLHLGDRRVCKLLWPIRELLEKDEIEVALHCTTGLLYAATLEFELDWLEGMHGDIEDGLFGVVAGGFGYEKRMNKLDVVFTGCRQFPVPKNPSPGDQEKARERAEPISVEKYGARIASRLYALERSEPPPRVMPQVLILWNLKPATELSDAAGFDDRVRNTNPSMPITPNVSSDGMITEVAEEWFDGHGRIFLVWGILNPNGPTLYCLGERRNGRNSQIFFRWLLMLGGRTYFCKAQSPALECAGRSERPKYL
jgi:hypothetical protein